MSIKQDSQAVGLETSGMVTMKGVVDMKGLRDILQDPQVNQLSPYILLFSFCQSVAQRRGRVEEMTVFAVSRTPEHGVPEWYQCEYRCDGLKKNVEIPARFVTLQGDEPKGNSVWAENTTTKPVPAMSATAR